MLPPELSTHQDDSEFQFDKVVATTKVRLYLLPGSSTHDSVCEHYSTDLVVEWIKRSNHHTIALQFPDHLVQDSNLVASELQTRLGSAYTVWVLADTLYSPCCVDEVAAEHVQGECVIHFGDACLTPVGLPSAHVLGRLHVDVAAAAAAFRSQYSPADLVVLMADGPHTHALPALREELQDYPHLAVAHIPGNTTIIDLPQLHTGTRIASRVVDVADPSLHLLFHLTLPPPPRLLMLSTQFALVALYDTDSQLVLVGLHPLLAKRYRFMHMARTAATVGILVNTLLLQLTRELIDEVAGWVKAAGKKHYMFVVGKPNVAKLANFEAVDVWCVLGCGHGGVVLDEYGEFYKPIVTPYELHLALAPEVSWTGQWVTDFERVLALEAPAHESADEHSSDSEPEFDPVSGRYVSARPLRQRQHLEVTAEEAVPLLQEGALVQRFSGQLVVGSTVLTLARALQSRAWTGLGSDFASSAEGEVEGAAVEGAAVEEGRGGMARGYDK